MLFQWCIEEIHRTQSFCYLSIEHEEVQNCFFCWMPLITLKYCGFKGASASGEVSFLLVISFSIPQPPSLSVMWEQIVNCCHTMKKTQQLGTIWDICILSATEKQHVLIFLFCKRQKVLYISIYKSSGFENIREDSMSHRSSIWYWWYRNIQDNRR